MDCCSEYVRTGTRHAPVCCWYSTDVCENPEKYGCVPNRAASKILKATQDMVDRPPHYQIQPFQVTEVVDVVEGFNLNHHTGDAVIYILRAGKKEPGKYVEDLRKAIWWLKREIERYNLSCLEPNRRLP